MATSIPASTHSASCVVPQAAFAYVPVTCFRHIAINLHQVSTTPTRMIPVYLSIAISPPLISAL